MESATNYFEVGTTFMNSYQADANLLIKTDKHISGFDLGVI